MFSFIKCLGIAASLLIGAALVTFVVGHLLIYFSTLPLLVRGIGGFGASTLVLAGFMYVLFGD